MIPVEEQPEPADFSPRVREPGDAFLKQVPRPANWKNREYWQRALADLYEAYDGTSVRIRPIGFHATQALLLLITLSQNP